MGRLDYQQMFKKLTKTLQRPSTFWVSFYIIVASASNVKEVLATHQWLLAHLIVGTEGYDANCPPIPTYFTHKLPLRSLP